MLENCLVQDESIGKLVNPLVGIVFHWDQHFAECEAAHLCSLGVKTRVLVPATNYQAQVNRYKQLPGSENLKVEKFFLQYKHLDMSIMSKLMAFNDTDGVPLYMEVSASVCARE